MITNNGKQIIAKYLLGQAPAFATHIAAGCGSRPVSPGEDLSENPVLPSIDSLDFEVFRVPIIAKGFVRENGKENIVFKAEMPTNQRYLISEIGIYPAAQNSFSGKYDSKTMITFSPTEQWEYVKNSIAANLTLPSQPIDNNNTQRDIDTIEEAQYVNSEASIFNSSNRKLRQEPPRFTNRAVIVSGSSSYIGEEFQIEEGSSYLQNNQLNFDLSRNSTADKIKLAFSLISKENNNDNSPDNVRIILQFINDVSQINTNPPKASLNIDLTGEDFEYENGINRFYVTKDKTIGDFIKDDNFSFANINLIKIYASVLIENTPTDDYFIILDGIRLDNVSSSNPLYSLIGYNKIISENSLPILKQENTNNYIEYRFGIGVDLGG
jgi:hypothetical protein